MNEILGLVDVLESYILDGKKIPFSDNVIVNEKNTIELIDKIRGIIQSNGESIRNQIDIKEDPVLIEALKTDKPNVMTSQYVKDEVNKAKKIKEGAEDYANYILANLQLTITKMQKNLLKLEKNIEIGREVVNTRINETEKKEETIE